ncbi:radical SAM protein [Nonomuraea salmonea]|uniref:radical SAM protein n=1 Tax=Nonomuraea salmonea TaxID=46181 RepID=UPI002FE770B1
MDAGADFDSKIVVKVNAAELARKELASPRWGGHHIAMGTNVDCYQRAEGRYKLMRGILAALRDAANPFSILTKGTLILRDLDLLTEAAEVTEVGADVSVGFVDPETWRAVEPGTPHPGRRLETCATLNDNGIACGVLMAPILPYLTDSPAQLDRTVKEIAAAGATHISPIVLHLRPGAREWWLSWLSREHPRLVPRYLELYGRGSYAPKAYQQRVVGMVKELARRHGAGRATPAVARRLPPARPATPPLSRPSPSSSACSSGKKGWRRPSGGWQDGGHPDVEDQEFGMRCLGVSQRPVGSRVSRGFLNRAHPEHRHPRARGCGQDQPD